MPISSAASAKPQYAVFRLSPSAGVGALGVGAPNTSATPAAITLFLRAMVITSQLG